jgi:hypothetical protein
MKFGEAKELLSEGFPMTREGWNGKRLFVYEQVECEIPKGLVPTMGSLPKLVKKILVPRDSSLNYKNQFCIVDSENNFQGWVPSVGDINADDWVVYSE